MFKGKVFIVAPSRFMEGIDVIHHVCGTNNRNNPLKDIYDWDDYTTLDTAISMEEAKQMAKDNGEDNPEVI